MKASLLLSLFVAMSPADRLLAATDSVAPAPEKPLQQESVVWTQRESKMSRHFVFGLCVTKKGTLLAFAEARIKPGDENPHHIALKRSTDQGTTWSENRMIIPSKNGECYANPTPVMDRASGRIFLFYAQNFDGSSSRVFYRTSDDDGATWSGEIELTSLFQNDPEKRPFHLPGPGHGIQLRSGRLVVPVWHRLPIRSDDKVVSSADRAYTVNLLTSDDGGKTWQSGGYLTPGNGANESRVVELANGDLLLNARSFGSPPKGISTRVLARSTDGGRTWSTPEKDQSMTAFVGCDSSLIRLDASAPKGEDWLMFSRPDSTQKRENITVSLSTDSGKSWPRSLQISPFGGYSDLVEIDNGLFGAIYTAVPAKEATTGVVRPDQEVNFTRFNLASLISSTTTSTPPTTMIASTTTTTPIPFLASAKPEEIDGKSYDVVVVGGTPGGIACAVRAAREGCTVLLINHTQHIGGFMTSGAGGWEAPYDGLRSPLYAEMRTGAANYYHEMYGEDSPQYRLSLPSAKSNAHIDRPKIEPRIAELLFDRMVTAEKTLTVLKGFVVSSVKRDGALVQSATFHELKGKRTVTVTGKIFVDGMYECDLAAAAKVPCQVGRESRSTYNEPHAGVIYVTEREKTPGQPGFPKDAVEGHLKIRYNSHATESILPESTGEGDKSVMAYNYRLILTKDPANRVMVTKPKNYNSDVVKKMAPGGFVPNLPNNKVAWNGGRLIGPQNDYPEGDWETRERISQLYLDSMLGLLWYLQNDPTVSEKDREKWKDYGLAADEFPDNNNIPYEIYVREARRLIGRHVFTEHDNKMAAGIQRTPIHEDSVAITDWPLDSVACLPRKVEGGHQDGIFFLAEESRPAQIPYRSLLAKGVDNLLVPVALSASHVGWGAIRLEPVWMQTGEAAGFAAALALRQNTTPAQLNSDTLLRALVENRTMVSFFNDMDVTSNDPANAAIQFLATKGFFNSYDALPGKPLDRNTAQQWAKTYAKLASSPASFDSTAEARNLPKVDAAAPTTTGLTATEFASLLREALQAQKLDGKSVDAALTELKLSPSAAISRGDACRLVYLSLKAASK